MGATLAPGETIITGARSRAEVTLPDGTVVRIGQASSFSFDGAKLVLNQGSALFHLTRKNTTIATPALVRTGQPGVVSVHASPSYNAVFALEGSDIVNGTALVAGQAWVRDRGTARTFAFDLKKMTSTSTLVTKFPVTPWIANAQALATIQQKLVAANYANPSQVQAVNRTAGGATKTIAANGITLTNGTALAAVSRSGATTGILGAVRSFFSGGSANVNAAQGSLTKASAGTLTLTGGRTTGAGFILNNSVSESAALVKTAGGTLQISNASGFSSTGASATLATIATGNTVTLNGTLNYSGNIGTLNTTSGTLVLNGTTNAGNANTVTITSGNLNLPSGFSPGTIIATGGTINGVPVSTLQLGQTVNVGTNSYLVGSTSGSSSFTLTRIAGVASPVLGARPPVPVALPPKPPGR